MDANPYQAPQAVPMAADAKSLAAPPPIVAAGLLLAVLDLIVCLPKAVIFVQTGMWQWPFDLRLEYVLALPWLYVARLAEFGSVGLSIPAAIGLLARKPWAVRFGWPAALCTTLSIVDQPLRAFRFYDDSFMHVEVGDSLVDIVGPIALRIGALCLYVAALRRFPAYLNTRTDTNVGAATARAEG